MSDFSECVIHNVETTDDIADLMRWLGERRVWLACDTETGGLDRYRAALRLIQFGDTRDAWVLRWDRWAGVALEVLKKWEGRLVFHNAKFDIQFVEHHSGEKPFRWGDVHDTMVMAHLLHPDRSKALKTLGARFLSPEARKLQNVLGAAMDTQGWDWGDIPYDFNIYWGYAGADVILTARLAEALWPEIDADYRSLYELDMEALRVCSDMEQRGFPIDVAYCERMYAQIVRYCTRLEDHCLETWNVRPSENQQVAAALQADGVDLTRTTPTGLWATDKDALAELEHPLAKLVVEHRAKTKVASTYFANFLDRHVSGVIHPDINTLGAKTGRASCSNPNLQNLPRGRVVRDAFVPRDGDRLITCDFDAIEMRLLAHFCGDRGMIEAIRTGDIHTEMARLMYGDPEISKHDPRRQVMKSANFAQAYGAGVEKLAATAEVPVEEAETFLEVYHHRFPGVRAFQRRLQDVAARRMEEGGKPWVKTPAGRQQISAKDKIYSLVNFLLQGTAGDIFKQALVDLDKAGFGAHLLLPVHDEVVAEVPEPECEDLKKQMAYVMTQETGWAVPLTVSAEGPYERWGAKYAQTR